MRRLLAVLALVLSAAALFADDADTRFRQANDLVRSGDYPRAIDAYHALAASGGESASLYWNWAQAAGARGALGEALWALLRARELDPGDRALDREIDRARLSANLDPAEIAPEPLAAVTRSAHRFHLGLLALALGALSVLLHALARLRPALGWPVPASWSLVVLAVLAGAVPVVGAFAQPTGAVVRHGAPLLDSASPTAQSVGTLREGEVVPVLEQSGAYVRVEDSSGARGWASSTDVRRLDRAPAGY